MKKPQTRRPQLLRVLLVGSLTAVTYLVSLAVIFHIWHLSGKWAGAFSFAISFVVMVLAALLVTYPDRLKPFARRRTYELLAVACCLFFVVIGLSAEAQSWHFSKTKGESITYDEISLLPNGYYYRTNGSYFVNPEHPPLVKDIAALPFNALHVQEPARLPKDVLYQDYAQYAWGKALLFDTGNNTEAMIFWARCFVLLANATLIFLLFWSLARVWSKRAGFIATFFLTTAQLITGHASLVTVDTTSALLTLLTLLWLSAWLKRWKSAKPTKTAAWLTSLSFAGALCAKFSTILLVPIVGLAIIGYGVAARKDLGRRWKKFAWGGVGIFVLAMLLVVLLYAYHVRNMAGADIVKQLSHSYDTTRLPGFGLRILDGATHFGILGRAFAEFCHGILMVNNRIYNGAFGVYFMGHSYGPEGAGPLYFPLLYLTKLQPMFLLVSLAGVVGCVWLAVKRKSGLAVRALLNHPLPVLLGLYAVGFAGIAIASTLQIGLRHIFPVIMATMILSGLTVDFLLREWKNSGRYTKYMPWTVAVVVVCMIGSVLCAFPNYLSYYNVFAGGTTNGYKLAVDSNYDWGQDIKQLAAWQQQHNVPDVRFDLFFNPFLPVGYYLGTHAQSYDVSKDGALAPGTYLAVSANQYELNTHRGLPRDKTYAQFDADQVARAGKTIFIYKIPSATAKR